MNALKVATGHQQVMSYLTVKGAYNFMDFLKNVFNAEEQLTVPRDKDLVMHAEMKIGDTTLLITDAVAETPANPAELFIYVKDTDAIYKKALKQGATALLEPETSEFVKRTAGIKDSFGNTWWLHTI